MSFASMHNDYLDPDKHLWDQESDNEPDVIYPDADDCYCLFIGDNKIRIGIAQNTNQEWFYEITFDTEHAVDSAEFGPFDSYEEAGFDGVNMAQQWFADNEFAPEELAELDNDISAILDAIHLDNEIVKSEQE